MPDSDGYPTNAELERIRNWNFNREPFKDFLAFVKSCWHEPEWGWRQTPTRLYLSCDGGSGNRLVIKALEDNVVFWSLAWLESRRGGHHKFRLADEEGES